MTTSLSVTDAALEAERDALVDALVATQDRLSGLVAMLKVPGDTLELDLLTDRMLRESLSLTGSDAVVLTCAHGRPNQRAVSGTAGHQLTDLLDHHLSALDLGSGTEHGHAWAATPFPGFPSRGIAIARLDGEPYTTGDIRMLETVAVAVEQLSQLSRLHSDVLRQATMAREHELACSLAQAVMPATLPNPPGLDFFARCLPASLTGGDFMVFTTVGDVLWFAIGDVAGKGLPAAMIMNQAVLAVRVAMRISNPDDPAEAVVVASQELADYLRSVESFVTLAVGSQRVGSGQIRLCNAGHSPIAYRAGPDVEPRFVAPSSPPLGVDARPPRTVTLEFPGGAALVIGTDGLVEQPDPAGEMIGYEAFIQASSGHGRSARELGEALLAQVEDHAAGTPAADDRTLMVLIAQDDPTAPVAAPAVSTPVVVLPDTEPTSRSEGNTVPETTLAELDLAANLGELRALGPWLEQFLQEAGATSALGTLELAVHEICVNVVTHAYELQVETRADWQGPPPEHEPGAAEADRLQVRGRADAEAIEITVVDHGLPFADDQTSEPIPGVPQIHGYGLMIVRKLVDELTYTREEGTNTWTLRTRR